MPEHVVVRVPPEYPAKARAQNITGPLSASAIPIVRASRNIHELPAIGMRAVAFVAQPLARAYA